MEIRRIHAKATYMRLTALTALACLTFTSPVVAQDTSAMFPDVETESALDEAALRVTFSGQTHRGTYTFLSRDIKTFAFTETTGADGSVLHTQGNKEDTGQWTVMKNIICYDYDDPALRQACFRIYQRGNCYYHYQVSVLGVSSYGFTARSVIAGETPSCEPSLV